MEYSVYDLLKDVDANLHAGGVSQLQNPFQTIDKGRRAVLGEVRPEELIRSAYIEDAIYPHVDRYACPSDLKYKDIINIQKLSSYRNVDTMAYPLELVYDRRFSQKRNRGYNTVSINYENGIKYISLFKMRGQQHHDGRKVIHNCNSLTDNGTWNIGGNVVNLKLNELNYVQDTGSLEFDINNSSTTGFIENFTLESFDLEDFLQKGAVFAWLNIPLPQEIVSVKLTLGSDTTNLLTDLYQSTVNQPHDNNAFTNGWNLLKYMMQNMTTVGTPNPKDLKYIRFDFTTTGNTIPAMGIDLIIAREGAVYEMTYNGTSMFIDPINGAFKKRPTSNGDIIIAEEDTYNLLVMETTLAAQFEIYGANATAQNDVASIKNQLKEMYRNFKVEHKSEAVLPTEDIHIFGTIYDGYSGPIESNDYWDRH